MTQFLEIASLVQENDVGLWAFRHEITSPMNISLCACLIGVEGGFVADGDVAAVGVGGVGQRVAVLPRGGGGGGRTARQAHHVAVAGKGTKRRCECRLTEGVIQKLLKASTAVLSEAWAKLRTEL